MTQHRATDAPEASPEEPLTDSPEARAAESEAADAPVPVDVAALQRERDDYYDRLMRKAAEFDNYRKRVERERREQGDQAVVELLRDLLAVVDDFDIALAIEGEPAAAYRKGVELIHAKLHDLLRRYRVRPIEALGAGFDPTVFTGFEDILGGLGDIFGFADLFGGGRRRGGPQRGADLRYDLEISFEEAAHGTETTIQIPRSETCEACNGSGAAAGSSPTD